MITRLSEAARVPICALLLCTGLGCTGSGETVPIEINSPADPDRFIGIVGAHLSVSAFVVPGLTDLEGDALPQIEQSLLSLPACEILHSDSTNGWILIGHHGGRTSTDDIRDVMAAAAGSATTIVEIGAARGVAATTVQLDRLPDDLDASRIAFALLEAGIALAEVDLHHGTVVALNADRERIRSVVTTVVERNE